MIETWLTHLMPATAVWDLQRTAAVLQRTTSVLLKAGDLPHMTPMLAQERDSKAKQPAPAPTW